MKNEISIITILFILLFNLSVSANTISDEDNISDWTIIIYLAGDNNLDGMLNDLFNDILSVGSNEDIKIVVQKDGSRIGDTRRYFIDSEGSKILIDSFNKKGGELNMGNPNNLVDFSNWAVENYPSEKYYLILSDHGSGWLGICKDESSNKDWITVNELKNALGSICTKLGKKLDLLLFNACLMNSVEVYSSISDFVEYVVGSQDEQYTNAYRYSGFLNALKQNPEWSSKRTAQETAESLFNIGIGNDISIIDQNNIKDLCNKIDLFAKELRSELPNKARIIRAAGQFVPSYFYYLDEYDISNKDLYIYSKNIAENPLLKQETRKAALSVMQAIDNSIVETHQLYDDANGLSILFNSGRDYEFKEIPTKYSLLDFAEQTEWDGFISDLIDSYANLSILDTLTETTEETNTNIEATTTDTTTTVTNNEENTNPENTAPLPPENNAPPENNDPPEDDGGEESESDPPADPILIVSVTPTSATVEEGETVEFIVETSGGSGNNYYLFYGGDNGSASGNMGESEVISYTYSESGTFEPDVEVHDLDNNRYDSSYDFAVIAVVAENNQNGPV